MNKREQQIDEILNQFQNSDHRNADFDDAIEELLALPIVCDEMVWGWIDLTPIKGSITYELLTEPVEPNHALIHKIHDQLAYIITKTRNNFETSLCYMGCEGNWVTLDVSMANGFTWDEAKAACQAHLNETVNAMKGGGK